ncbi:zinc ribbon domain-containing protein [Methanoregula sp.]|uniref:zinc ribbon domain-containing protein n=1 Tax=Methanoregula sp. TaxID=2052170 RepID=UPI0035670B72
MTNPNSDTDEQIILDSSSISIKGVQFRVILTNYRIALYNSSTQKQNDITLSEVQKVKAESGLVGDPTILLFILSQSGENKKMIFNFSPDHENERNQWITEINNLIQSNSKIPSNGIIGSPVNSDVIDQQSDTFFCSRCGNRVIDGSSFCNRCGTKISPPAQPIVNYQNNGKGKYAEESSKISTEKITLPARKTQYADTNIPYTKTKESRNIPLNNEQVGKKFNFTLPTISNQKPSVAALCCGGIILLIVISAIFSSITHGSTSSTTNSNSLTNSASSEVSSTTAKSGEPGEALSTYLFAYQHVGSTFPVKISADSLYDYLSKNATSTMSKQEVGIVVSSVRSEWTIFDYKIGETKKQGKYATVTVDIIWQSKNGIQISRTEQIPLVFEDNKWKLDKFFYSM